MLHYMAKPPMRRLAVTLLCALLLLPEGSCQSGRCYRRRYCSANNRDTTGVTRNECFTTNGFQSWVRSGDDPSKACCTRRSGPCRRSRCQGACSNSDPHFRTWFDYAYDYHGACDLVLLKSAYMDIHIRTEDFGGWSAIVGVAIKVKQGSFDSDFDLLEIQLPDPESDMPSDVPLVFFQGEYLGSDPELAIQLAAHYRYDPEASSDIQEIQLPGDQFLRVSLYRESFAVDIGNPEESFFQDAAGLYGTWDDDSGNGMLSRDRTIRYDRETANAFGEEWQVNEALDGPSLFIWGGQDTCTYSPPPSPRLIPLDAAAACAGAFDEDLRRDCEFDVMTTGDITWAQNPVYTESPPEPVEQCLAEGTECEAQGGFCMWRCNENVFDCNTSLCKGAPNFDEFSTVNLRDGEVSGCACALELTGTAGKKCNIFTFALQLLLGWLFGFFGIVFCDLEHH